MNDTINQETLDLISPDTSHDVPLFKMKGGKSANVSTLAGKRLPFKLGKFYTNDLKDQEFLRELAESNQCGVYVDPDEPTINPYAATPEELEETRIRNKIMREIATANKAPVVNPGDSKPAAISHVATTAINPEKIVSQGAGPLPTVKVSGEVPNVATESLTAALNNNQTAED